MNFRSKRRRTSSADISLTPLIDLFLNILVFFLISTSFSQDKVFFVDLPKAQQGEGQTQEQNQITVTLKPDETLLWGNETMLFSDFVKKLKSFEGNKKEVPVLLRADQSAKHGFVVKVLDVFKSEGYEKLGLATQTP